MTGGSTRTDSHTSKLTSTATSTSTGVVPMEMEIETATQPKTQPKTETETETETQLQTELSESVSKSKKSTMPENNRKKSSLAGSSETKKKKLNNDVRENVGMTEEERLYEESAKAIAEKVQRQQEGIETAMLSHEHKDESFKTVDEIQKLLEEQVGGMAGSMSRSKGLLSSFSTSSTSATQVSANVTEEIGEWFIERSKYIPVRLTLKERKKLRLIEAIMKCCEYTDMVDSVTFKNEQRRQLRQIQCILAVLGSSAVSLRYEEGSTLVETKEFALYGQTFQALFEFGRRYKILNPEKMRGTYGKMVMLLQDSLIPVVRQELDFDLVVPVKTVYEVLKEAGALEALKSEWISTATMEIVADGKSRPQINRELKRKEYALQYISQTYENSNVSADSIKQCLYSIGENSNYISYNSKPVDYMIDLLKKYFNPEVVKEGSKWSLAIYGDKEGSRLTHSHERQYYYVLQSLTLWREIVHDMFRLWSLAEEDLLDFDTRYKLKDTGQGIHRLQPAPRTLKAMHAILYAVQQKTGTTMQGWVGSSVIHLGDTNVPNALVFIDKYNQVPRILNPIVQCLKHLEKYVVKDPKLLKYIHERYENVEDAKKTIVHSFFRGAFDGSGGENFFEAGSCIDGRLTSAWNWCQQLPDKPFYYLFRLSGFLGFDGNFQA